MPFVTHFKSPEGEDLLIAAAELVTVEVPAAGSTDLGGWGQAAEGGAYYMQNTFTDAPAASAVLQSCTDPSAITDHGLRIEFDEALQDWVLWIDSLPETACTFTLLFINHSTEDTPCVLPALGVGTGGGPAATQYTVEIPAAGSEDLKGWWLANGVYMRKIVLEGVTEEEMAVQVGCPVDAIFTEHGLYVTQDTGVECSIELELSSLPAAATFLYLLVQHAEGGGAVYMPVINQSGGSLPEVVLTTPVENGTTFTAEENAALAAALATGKPVIVKSTIMETPGVVMVMNNFAGQGFVAVYANYNFLLMDTGEGWSALIEEMRVLPEATEDDEGKFVQVVGGAYELVALQDVSKEGA